MNNADYSRICVRLPLEFAETHPDAIHQLKERFPNIDAIYADTRYLTVATEADTPEASEVFAWTRAHFS